MQIIVQRYHSPVGELILGEYDRQLCLCDWEFRSMRNQIDQRIQKGLNANFLEEESDFLLSAMEELDAYFDGSTTPFKTPLALVGTDFQKQVWEALLHIPYGTTMSYLDLSRQLGDEKAIRAVASANGANALSIFVPCHRVIGSNGDLTGYAGGLTAKKRLLQLEGINIGNQLELF